MARTLSPSMTPHDVENGYWYLDQLKNLAGRIGIPAAKKLRKDELENAILVFLRTGTAALPAKRSLRKTGVKDLERGLDVKVRIENYTSNRRPKDFIIEQVRPQGLCVVGQDASAAQGKEAVKALHRERITSDAWQPCVWCSRDIGGVADRASLWRWSLSRA